MTGWCLALLLLGKGAPVWCAASAALLFSAFLGFAGSAETNVPGFRQEFMLILVISIAGSFFLAARMDTANFRSGMMTVEGTVQKERPWGRGRVVILDSHEGRFVVHLSPSALFSEGDVITVRGLAEQLDPHPAESGFDEGTYWISRGAEGIFRHASASKTGKKSWGFPRWRTLLRERILTTMPPLMRGYLLASWLGSRDPDLAEKHSSWGTSHLLAVSGLHVGIVVLILFTFIPARFFRFSAASLAMWLYVLVAGASSSAMRAGLMLQAGFVGRWIGRPLAAVNSVSVAGFLLLLWRPWLFWDLGWRLSMLAALLLSSIHDHGAKKVWLLAPLLLWVCTAGLVSDAFGTVPVAGIVVNMIAVPVFGVLLPLASLLALPALAGIWGGVAVAAFGEMLFSAWAYFADLVTVLLPWKVPFSAILNITGVILASFLLLRGIGFGRAHAAVFAASITVFLVML